MPPIPLNSCSTQWLLSAFADEAAEQAADQANALNRAKIKHIDVRGVDGFNVSALPLDRAREVKHVFDTHGIRVNMLGSPIGKIDIADDMEVDLKKLRHLAEVGDVLHCRRIRIFSYFNKNNAPMNEWQRIAIDRLLRLRDLAAELDLVLFHENERHIFGDRLEQVLVIADELRDGGPSPRIQEIAQQRNAMGLTSTGGSGIFRLIFDFDNFNQSGDDVWANWQALATRTDAIHLKDSHAGQHMPVGQGSGKVREILTDALRRGWAGPLSLEPHLTHSKAVMNTGPHGVANQAFTDMSPADSFNAAAEAAIALLGEIKAPVA